MAALAPTRYLPDVEERFRVSTPSNLKRPSISADWDSVPRFTARTSEASGWGWLWQRDIRFKKKSNLWSSNNVKTCFNIQNWPKNKNKTVRIQIGVFCCWEKGGKIPQWLLTTVDKALSPFFKNDKFNSLFSAVAEPEPVEPKSFGDLKPEPKINLNKHFLQSVCRMLGRRKANFYLD